MPDHNTTPMVPQNSTHKNNICIIISIFFNIKQICSNSVRDAFSICHVKHVRGIIITSYATQYLP